MLWPTSSSDEFTVSPARTAIELTSAAALFRAYARALPVDLAPQGFAEELKALPGVYAPPAGELLLAKRGDHVLGAVALKPLAPPHVAEIKRLFVRPQARKIGVGKALVAAILKTAVERGYREVKLPIGLDRSFWKKLFVAAKAGGIKNYFVEMNWDLMQASVPYLRKLKV